MFSALNKSVLAAFKEAIQTPSGVVYAIVDNPDLEGDLSGKRKDYNKIVLGMLEVDAMKLKVGISLTVREKTWHIAKFLNDGAGITQVFLTTSNKGSFYA